MKQLKGSKDIDLTFEEERLIISLLTWLSQKGELKRKDYINLIDEWDEDR